MSGEQGRIIYEALEKARIEERLKIANYVELSRRLDNCSLARDIREGKYEK